ncbi:MAG: DUF3592 domain-containing protein [Ilumatobacteraceae bacterium]|jgi:hypothetical protein
MWASWGPAAAPLAVLAGLGARFGRRARRGSPDGNPVAGWAQTVGTVLSATVKIRRLGQIRAEIPMVIYSYEVDGRPYQSYRVRASDDTGQIPVVNHASITLDRYPVGSNVTVYYDPDDPANAALER